MKQKMPPIDAVVQVTKCLKYNCEDRTSQADNYDVLRGVPAWAYVTNHHMTGFNVEWLETDQEIHSVLLKWDRFKVVPLDKLPDHICVLLAKRALLGEGDET